MSYNVVRSKQALVFNMSLIWLSEVNANSLPPCDTEFRVRTVVFFIKQCLHQWDGVFCHLRLWWCITAGRCAFKDDY